MPFATAETPQDQNRENVTDVVESTDLPSQVVGGTIDIDLADYIVEEEIFLEPTDNIEKELPQISGRSSTIGEDTARARELNQRTAKTSTPPQSRNPVNFSNSLPVTGQYLDYGPYPVAPGEIIEAKLYAPPKSPTQYLLSLYYWNGIEWTLIDYSMLGTGGGVVYESVGKVNTLTDTVYFIVSVDALTNGDGNDTYNLTIATSAGCDNYEENNSVYYSKNFIIPDMSYGQFFSYSANLHSAVDVDRVTFSIPGNASYSDFYFTENNTTNVIYELFEIDSNGNPSLMSKGSNGEYSVTPGKIYHYRISSANTGVAYPRNYTFELRTYAPVIQTARLELDWNLNGGPVPTQNYSTYGNRYALLQNGLLEVWVSYYTANNTLNVTENDTVTVAITNRAWNPNTPSYGYYTSNSGTASGGVAYVPLNVGLVYGQVTVQTQYSIWYYDWDVTLTIISGNYSQTLNLVIPIYLVTRLN